MKTDLKSVLLSDHGTSVSAPTAKTAALFALLGISTWTDVAAIMAAFYSFLLICEWFWKRLGRPFCERQGWLKRPKRRKEDAE